MKEKVIGTESKFEELVAERMNQLLVQQKINTIQKRDLNRLARKTAQEQIIYQSIKNYEPKKVKLTKVKNKKYNSLKDCIYLLSDFHYRGSIDKQLVIDLFNQINQDIHNHKYENVELWMLGDYVDGEIHQEQIRVNEPLIDCVNQITDLLVSCINQIKEIKFVKMVYGNHDEARLWDDKGTTNNTSKTIAFMLSKLLRKDIKIEYDKQLWFEYKGKLILLVHGDEKFAKSKNKLIETCASQYKALPDVICMGHFHTSKTNQFSKNCWLIVAPAIKNWEGKYDKEHGYCGLGQFVKLKLNLESPQFTTINIKGE